MTQHTIGEDISKAHLGPFRLQDGAAHRFENSAAGFRALQRWLGKPPIARIVFEPTGPYHKAFEAAFSKTFPSVKVNPLHARRFAEARGTRAKTVAVDKGVFLEGSFNATAGFSKPLSSGEVDAARTMQIVGSFKATLPPSIIKDR